MTNAIEEFSSHLRDLGVEGKVVEFDSPAPTAVTAAELIGCEVDAIGNSLVFAVEDEPLLVVASGAHRVDTKLLATRLECGKIKRASPEFVLDATGQPVGGVAPVGHPRPIRTVIDRSLSAHPEVWVAAGAKHAVFPTTFDELLRITGGTAHDVR